MLGKSAGGAAFDLGRAAGSSSRPWALTASVGLACAASLLSLDRSALRMTQPPAAQ